ncbi:Domain of uncharacterised function (DUF2825) [Salmonella enterica subsp. enterica serovar Typhimurium str. DT104]|nr:Domain of uncharacterised function (DUF2825) [Salmonella enterica subsp. enterica serovar Typhimurium str. DT104]
MNAVYPRWRGEHTDKQPHSLFRFDLSLLARGTLLNNVVNSVSWRFIPAGAGNTSNRNPSHRNNSVYPRWRGEHTDKQPHSLFRFGLSPLARGTRSCQTPSAFRHRFIPASAGNTIASLGNIPSSAVYPRWRGEHGHYERIGADAGGLSPLARGTQELNSLTVEDLRFIPAGAGNTPDKSFFSCSCSVYPRWRGEHGKATPFFIDLAGLSPLARGTLDVDEELLNRCRFIPAGAGNT